MNSWEVVLQRVMVEYLGPNSNIQGPEIYGCAFQKFCRPVYYIYSYTHLSYPSPLLIFISPFKLDNLLNMHYDPLNPRLNLCLFQIIPSLLPSSNCIFFAFQSPFFCCPFFYLYLIWCHSTVPACGARCRRTTVQCPDCTTVMGAVQLAKRWRLVSA